MEFLVSKLWRSFCKENAFVFFSIRIFLKNMRDVIGQFLFSVFQFLIRDTIWSLASDFLLNCMSHTVLSWPRGLFAIIIRTNFTQLICIINRESDMRQKLDSIYDLVTLLFDSLSYTTRRIWTLSLPPK